MARGQRMGVTLLSNVTPQMVNITPPQCSTLRRAKPAALLPKAEPLKGVKSMKSMVNGHQRHRGFCFTVVL